MSPGKATTVGRRLRFMTTLILDYPDPLPRQPISFVYKLVDLRIRLRLQGVRPPVHAVRGGRRGFQARVRHLEVVRDRLRLPDGARLGRRVSHLPRRKILGAWRGG